MVLSDSQESEFVYDLPDGYNSQDENNPDYISMMSSGNSSNGDDDQKHIADLLSGSMNGGNIEVGPLLNLDNFEASKELKLPSTLNEDKVQSKQVGNRLATKT